MLGPVNAYTFSFSHFVIHLGGGLQVNIIRSERETFLGLFGSFLETFPSTGKFLTCSKASGYVLI